ncbi:RecB-like helicase [Campylobacter devanensis]|uniref:RecB-like helicase n=1 Tax=Campylobacter devanensis TaxID=3161138 RepID=UPI000A343005|nr:MULTISPECIES: RecB-like helicase [unclassified Campylobacter]
MKFENYLCLEASAGSGKTFALSVRYIALLLKGNHPRKILALTFTNKAANEMKHRITDTFCNLDSSECDGERNTICELLGKSKEEVLALRDKFMADFLASELKISTFDSFFATILRQFSLNLGLMPDFNSLNDNSIDVKNEFKRLLNSNSMMSTVAKYLYYTNSKENSLFEKLALLSQTKFDKFDAPWPNPKNAMDRYNALCDVALKFGSDKYYVANFNKNLSLNEIVEKAVVKDIDKKYFNKVRDNAEFNAARDEFISALKEYYLALEKYEISQISYFVDLYKKAIANVNRRENSLSFADITNWVNELLTSKNKQDIDMLYFRLDAKIRHILIDEFQDTDIKQYEILEPLIAESLSGIGQSGVGSFFYVGDIKQSIYRFRGGQSELFNKLKEDFSQIKAQSLDKNYRSDKEIVKYVNEMFQKKYPHYINQIPNSKDDGYVGVVKFDREKYLEAIYDSIKKLEDNGIEHKDMAILCWKNSDIYNIKDFLEGKGLEVSTQTTNNLIKSANVAAVVAFLKYSIFGDEIYLNTQYEITKTKKAKLELKSDASVAQTLKFIAKYLELEPCDVDLLKLYEISSRYSDIYDFAFNIDNDQTTSAKNSQKGITIMTVHKSKGLQFDHVIVLDYIGKENSQKDKFLMEYNLGTNSWDIRLANKVFEYLGDENYIQLQDRQKELDRKEVINKTYVALTRAKHSLIILAKDNPNGNNISYFTKYESNGQKVEYLNLDLGLEKEWESGIIKPNSDKKQESKPQITDLKPFEKIAPQEILTSDKPKESLNLDSIYFGKALHYYLESIDFADFNSLKIAQNCLYNKFGAFINQDDLKEIKDRVDRLLNNPQFLEIIKDKRLYQEQDIGFNEVLKRIDLLCVNSDEIEIIDYKTSLKNSDEHKEQVREYLDILSQIYPQKNLKASIIYILHDEIQISKL